MADNTVEQWMAIHSGGEAAIKERAIVADLAGRLDLGVMTLSQVIVDMGPFVAPEEDLTMVARALALLPAVLRTVQAVPASRQDVHALVDYLCVRLGNEDDVLSYRAGLKEVAESLSVLTNWKKFPPGDAALVAQSIFKLVQGPSGIFVSQKPETRLAFYTLISFLSQKFQRQLQRDLGLPLLISGIVDLAELEKSPLCLRVLFMLYAQISREWELATTESNRLWELFVRYYPITLGGTVLDPNKPSPEELKALLQNCFTSSDKYASDAFTLLLSNLDTDQAAQKKKDIMVTIHDCVTSYSSLTMLKHAREIWSALKYEIWNGENEEFIVESLRILKGLFSCLSNLPEDSKDSTLLSLVTDISNEIYDKMSDNRHFLKSSGRLLQAICSSSSSIFALVTRAIMPKLDVLAQSVELPLERKSLLSVFNNILQARLVLESSEPLNGKNRPTESPDDSFLKFRQVIVDVYFRAMSRVDAGQTTEPTISTAMEGLALLNKIPEFLSEAEKVMILQKIDSILSHSSREDEIHEVALHALESISSRDPVIFAKITLPNFMKLLPDRIPEETTAITDKISVLQDLIFVACSSVAAPTGSSLPALPQRNFSACMEELIKLWQSLNGQANQMKYSNAILASIYRGLELFDVAMTRSGTGLAPSNGEQGVSRYSNIVMTLFSKAVKQKTTKFGDSDIKYIGLADEDSLNETSVYLLGKIATLALRSDSTHSSKENNFLLLWEEQHETSAIWSLFNPAVEQSGFPQEDLRLGPNDKCLVNFLSLSLLAGIKPQDKSKLKIRVGDTALAMLLNAVSVQNSYSKLARTSMLWFLQLLVNKFGALDEPLTKEPSSLIQCMVDLISNSSSTSGEELDNLYRALSYFTAATIASHKPQSSILLDLMIKGISNPRNGRKVAQSFRILLAPSELMNEANFCTIRRLRKQRVFSLTFTPLITLWRTSPAKEIQEDALLAIAGLLAYMEPTTLSENAESLVPVILEGTNVQNDDWAKHAFISTILTLLPLSPKPFESHLDSLINRMTDRTHNTYDSPSDSSVRCRTAALDVLALLVQYIEPQLLARRKNRVMSELDVALDDISSLVRGRADKCKMAWFNLED